MSNGLVPWSVERGDVASPPMIHVMAVIPVARGCIAYVQGLFRRYDPEHPRWTTEDMLRELGKSTVGRSLSPHRLHSRSADAIVYITKPCVIKVGDPDIDNSRDTDAYKDGTVAYIDLACTIRQQIGNGDPYDYDYVIKGENGAPDEIVRLDRELKA